MNAKRRDRKVLPVLLLVLALGLTSAAWTCNQQNYVKAAQAAASLPQAVGAFQGVEIDLHNQGLVSDNEHRQIQTLILQVAAAGKELDKAVNVAHSQPQATAALQASLTAVQGLLDQGILGIKNEHAKTTLQAVLVSVKGLVATIATVIQVQTTPPTGGTQ